MKHTPTPWKYQDIKTEYDNRAVIMVENETELIARLVKVSNAAYIVHCVNMHEELVEALKYLLPIAEAHAAEYSVIDEEMSKFRALLAKEQP